MSGILGAHSVPDPRAPHLCLWNTPAFFALGRGDHSEYTRCDHRDLPDGRLLGSLVGAITAEHELKFTSGFSAPFAGPDFVRDYETVKHTAGLLYATLSQVEGFGVERVELRTKPAHYGEPHSHVEFALLTAGLAVAEANLNYYLDLRGISDVGEWSAGLKHQVRRTLQRARSNGVHAEVADEGDEPTWSAAYRVLETNRVSKGRPMRLGFDYVWRLKEAFPGLVRMVVAREGQGRVCAAALLYRVSLGHDLVQYWGDADHTLPSSPMPLLVEAVVDHSMRTGASFVDLGISTDHGSPNHGLIQFKRNIGARAETRLVLTGHLPTVLVSEAWERLLG